MSGRPWRADPLACRTMRVFLTGATGFIGGEIARRLLARGDSVVALVRDLAAASGLAQKGAELVAGDLADEDVIRSAVQGCDTVIHAAAVYAVGIRAEDRPAMYRTNVLGTDRVLRAARIANVQRTVHVSTVNALGNTEGAVVDETHRHSGRYVSYYDETKHLAHEVAGRASAEGQPIVVAMPGAVYGPGDHSLLGQALQRFRSGRLPALVLADVGVTAVQRDDAAGGVIACLDLGKTGESYVLGGEITTLRGMIGVMAAITGRSAPRLTVPTSILQAVAPLGPQVSAILGFPPNLREVISASAGVTYWAAHDKASAHLGYRPRPLAEGLPSLLQDTP